MLRIRSQAVAALQPVDAGLRATKTVSWPGRSGASRIVSTTRPPAVSEAVSSSASQNRTVEVEVAAAPWRRTRTRSETTREARTPQPTQPRSRRLPSRAGPPDSGSPPRSTAPTSELRGLGSPRPADPRGAVHPRAQPASPATGRHRGTPGRHLRSSSPDPPSRPAGCQGPRGSPRRRPGVVPGDGRCFSRRAATGCPRGRPAEFPGDGRGRPAGDSRRPAPAGDSGRAGRRRRLWAAVGGRGTGPPGTAVTVPGGELGGWVR